MESKDLFLFHSRHYVLGGDEKRHSDKIETALALKSGLNLFGQSENLDHLFILLLLGLEERTQKKAKICSSQTANSLPPTGGGWFVLMINFRGRWSSEQAHQIF